MKGDRPAPNPNAMKCAGWLKTNLNPGRRIIIENGQTRLPAPLPKAEPTLSPPVRPLLPVAVVAMGVGAACFAVGAVLMATTSAPRTNVSGSVVRVFPEDADKVVGIQRAQTAGVALLAVGVGVAAAGAGLFLFGPQKPAAVVVPIAGGGAVVLTGRLP